MAILLAAKLSGIALFLIGVIWTLFCVIRLFIREVREARARWVGNDIERDTTKENLNLWSKMIRHDLPVTGLVVIVLVGGLLLRLDGLGSRSMSHPELYVPGIELPKDISVPPPLLSLPQTMWWHFHNEVHPQAYYLLMWGWTKLFGTSLFALRLPSAIFGMLSLILVFFLACQVFDRWTGLIGMALLAFNGHHLYWSQMARMYSMVCFLGLLSTLLLVMLFSTAKRRPVLESLYVAVSFLGVLTEIYFWPFLAAQILWTIACTRKGGSKVTRIISVQALAVILGGPMWAQAIYAARSVPIGSPSPLFLAEYLSFGFLFERDNFSLPQRQLPEPLILLFALLAVMLIARALRSDQYQFSVVNVQEPLSARKLLSVATGSIVIILGMSILASRRQYLMILTVCIPMLALSLAWTVNRLVSMPVFARLKRFADHTGPRSLLVFLGFVPAFIVFAVSFIIPLLGSRLFLLFTPFVLILIGEGIRRCSHKWVIVVPLTAVLMVMYVSSLAYYKQTPSDSRDYQELAQKMIASVEEPDLIFVRRRSWTASPLFYYMSKSEYRFIAEDFQTAVEHNPNSRVWLVLFGEQEPADQQRSALAGFKLERTINSRRGNASLFVRNGQAGTYATQLQEDTPQYLPNN